MTGTLAIDPRGKYASMPATEAPLIPRPRPSRQPHLLSLRAWFWSRPQVQWAMANLGIRRWLTIRRWPPALFAGAFVGTTTDRMHGPHWQLDLIQLALRIAFIVAVLAIDAHLTWRASRLSELRSRPAYLAMGISLLVLAVGCFTAVARFDAHDNPSLADASGFIGFLASWATLLSLGRALTRGRLRRLCWVYPPTVNHKD
jgi:hypothetical protein